MARRVAEFEVLGPWSLQTSRQFWEGFTPAALAARPTEPELRPRGNSLSDRSWRRPPREAIRVRAHRASRSAEPRDPAVVDGVPPPSPLLGPSPSGGRISPFRLPPEVESGWFGGEPR